MTTTPDTTDVTTLARAIEARDAEAITSLYAEDATVTLLDRDHPPSGPQVLTGREQIGGVLPRRLRPQHRAPGARRARRRGRAGLHPALPLPGRRCR